MIDKVPFSFGDMESCSSYNLIEKIITLNSDWNWFFNYWIPRHKAAKILISYITYLESQSFKFLNRHPHKMRNIRKV